MEILKLRTDCIDGGVIKAAQDQSLPTRNNQVDIKKDDIYYVDSTNKNLRHWPLSL